ncbi:hypothetical protein ABWE97_00110 [Pasteurella multocida]|uniref:hypothetical protein n=1 Tax=Pasteurella multocida TaxID=747 RepID=UPI0039791E3A
MGKRFLYKNEEYEFTPYSTEDYENICLTIDDIKKALNLDFSSYKKDGTIKKCTNENVSETQNNDFDISDVLNLHNEPMQENPITQQQTDQITELQKQHTELQAQVAELKKENQSLKQAQENNNKAQRISQPQKDIFTLLTVKNYPNCQSRNELFLTINADLRANRITTKDIQYSTLDRLIDENIRTGTLMKSPFPPKQK